MPAVIVILAAVFFRAWALANHITVIIVAMIVMMSVNRHLRSLARPKKRQVCRVVGDLFRVSGTAYMLIEADNRVRGCHHQVQVV